MVIKNHPIAAVILAGGRATRMGYLDKPLENLSDKPLIEWTLEALQKHAANVVISANHNTKKYEYLQLPIVNDISNRYCGPLIGIYSAMVWIEANLIDPPQKLLCLPGDVPIFPSTLIHRLLDEFNYRTDEVAWTECDGQVQPLFSIWSLASKNALKTAIANGIYGPKLAMPMLKNKLVSIERTSPLDFQNINDQDSLNYAQKTINQL